MPDRNKELIRSFAENEALMDVVKQLLLSRFSIDGLKDTEDDIKLGQLVRARLVCLQAIESAWKEIGGYRSFSKKEKQNPAY